MSANQLPEGKDLIQAAIASLQERLPSTWEVKVANRTVSSSPGGAQAEDDALIDVVTIQQGAVSFLVEAKRSMTPREAEQLFSAIARRFRRLNPFAPPILVVAPWLSARTQGILAKDGINYLDLTGNIRIETASSPMIFLSSQGATRNPATAPRSKASLRGPKAGRLFRFLADVTPPYGVTQIASATGLAAGYVSRLLETMDDEALIERSRRGQVLSTATTSILRRWAEIYGVFKTNRAASFVAPQGPANLLGHFDDPGIEGNVAVTGSFAAVRLAPVAGPALLVAYSNKPDAVSAQLGLLPAERGANVVLLGPFDEVVWERTTVDNGVTYVTPSQVAVDCLTGNGRMPAEGEALLAWMEQNESRWRLLSIDAIRVDGAGT